MSRAASAATGRAEFARGLEPFWHPVCTEAELDRAGDRPRAARLLGRDLAIARLADRTTVALDDRCAHRSTRLSIGRVDGTFVRCAYHGWAYDADGACVDIPGATDATVPARARVGSHATAVEGGTVWVRLAGDSELPVPSTWADHGCAVEPDEWDVAAARRVEAAIDLWHPGARFVDVQRRGGEIRFDADPATTGGRRAAFRVVMPFTVVVTEVDGEHGAGSVWRLTAAPVDDERTRWYASTVGPDAERLAGRLVDDARHQADIVVTGRTDGRFPIDAHDEVSVRGDIVSNVYRRWLRELGAEARRGGSRAVAASLAAAGRRAIGATG